MAIIVYRYAAFWPKDWDKDCELQMRLQTDIWNELVKIYTHQVFDRLDRLLIGRGAGV